MLALSICLFFFFNDTATTEIYTLSLHDALPISATQHADFVFLVQMCFPDDFAVPRVQTLHLTASAKPVNLSRSEEHTSELQSRLHLVCRLLLEKKNKQDV